MDANEGLEKIINRLGLEWWGGTEPPIDEALLTIDALALGGRPPSSDTINECPFCAQGAVMEYGEETFTLGCSDPRCIGWQLIQMDNDVAAPDDAVVLWNRRPVESYYVTAIDQLGTALTSQVEQNAGLIEEQEYLRAYVGMLDQLLQLINGDAPGDRRLAFEQALRRIANVTGAYVSYDEEVRRE